MTLKDQGIYRLPNGRELVARLIAERQTILYNLSAADPAAYELNPDGRLLFKGRLTAWAINDLRDTGRFTFGSHHPLKTVGRQNGT